MNTKNAIYAFYLLAAALLVVSCKSSRMAGLKGHTEQISNAQLFQSVDAAQLKFHSFSGKFSCELESKEFSQSLKGSIRIVHDSAIWISITPGLGIEAARLLMTPDSVFLINRLKSSYFKGKFTQLKQLLHIEVDYSTLEAILTNKAFVIPANNELLNDFRGFELIRKAQFYQLDRNSSKELAGAADTKFSYDAAYRLFESRAKLEQKKMFLEAFYSEFAPIDGKQYPMLSLIKLGSTGKSFNLRMQYTKVETDQVLEFPFRIPESYQPANY